MSMNYEVHHATQRFSTQFQRWWPTWKLGQRRRSELSLDFWMPNVLKRVPVSSRSSDPKRGKSDGARSGLCWGCGKISQPFSIQPWVIPAVWGLELSGLQNDPFGQLLSWAPSANGLSKLTRVWQHIAAILWAGVSEISRLLAISWGFNLLSWRIGSAARLTLPSDVAEDERPLPALSANAEWPVSNKLHQW